MTSGTAEHTRRVVSAFKRMSAAERLAIIRKAGIKAKPAGKARKTKSSASKRRR